MDPACLYPYPYAQCYPYAQYYPPVGDIPCLDSNYEIVEEPVCPACGNKRKRCTAFPEERRHGPSKKCRSGAHLSQAEHEEQCQEHYVRGGNDGFGYGCKCCARDLASGTTCPTAFADVLRVSCLYFGKSVQLPNVVQGGDQYMVIYVKQHTSIGYLCKGSLPPARAGFLPDMTATDHRSAAPGS